MAIIYNHLRRLLILCFAFFYILNYFVKSPELGIIVSVLIILVVSQNFLALPKTNLRVCATLILLGSLILIWKGASLQLWLAAAAKNAGLVTLFISVPLMGLPFFYENYQEELKHVAQRYMTNVWSFCLLTAVTVHMLGVIISVGAVALVYELFKENARLYKADKLFYAALLQGYMTTGYWSPAWASMAVVTQDLKLPWLSFVPVGIVLTIISLVITLGLIYLDIKQHPDRYRPLIADSSVEINWSHIVTTLVLAGSLILLIVLFNLFTTWDLLTIIPLMALIFPVLTALVQGKIHQLRSGLKNYYNNRLFSVKTEVILFASAGFLGKSLEASGVSKAIPGLLPGWLTQSPYLTIMALMLIMMVISLPGIHPIVSGSALVGAINPVLIGLSTWVFALTIIGGWAIAILVSPFSATNLIVSGLSGEPSWNLSLKTDGLFGLVILIVLTLILGSLALAGF